MKNNETRNNVFFKNTFMMYLMTACSYLFPLILLPYLTRVLEPSMYGVVTYMTAVTQFCQMIIDFGFMFSATKIIAENKEDNKHISKVVFSVVQAKIILAFVSFLLLCLFVPFMEILKDNLFMLVLYFLSAVLGVFSLDFLYRGIEKMEIITIRTVLSRSIALIMTIFLVRSSSDAIFVPFANCAGLLFSCVWTWFHAMSKLGIKIYFVSFKEVIESLKVSSIYFVSNSVTFGINILNTFILGIINVPSEQIACWTLANQFITAAEMMISPIISSLYPHNASIKDFTLSKKLLITIEPIIVIGCIIVCACAEWIVFLLCGPGYSEAVPVFQILTLVVVVSFPVQLLGYPVLGNMGKEKAVSRNTVIAAIFHVLLIAVLLYFGALTLINLAIIRVLSAWFLFFEVLILLWSVARKTKEIKKS